MVDYFLNESIHTLFEEFYQGFHKVCGGDALLLFMPHELEGLICGTKEINIAGLRKITRYDGYDEDSQVVEWFWEVMGELTED